MWVSSLRNCGALASMAYAGDVYSDNGPTEYEDQSRRLAATGGLEGMKGMFFEAVFVYP